MDSVTVKHNNFTCTISDDVEIGTSAEDAVSAVYHALIAMTYSPTLIAEYFIAHGEEYLDAHQARKEKQ